MNFPRVVLPFIVLLTAAANTFGAEPIEALRRAPTLDIQELLQASDGSRATWDTLRGKVVVLEFWATWCPPCVRAIPHLNALADALKDKPVQFISITDEDKATVTEFLAHHVMSGWIALNPTGSTFKNYKVDGRPLTIVVRPDGMIDAMISPLADSFPIRAENLLNLVAGKSSGLVSSQVVYAGEVHDESGMPLSGVAVNALSMASDSAFGFLGADQTDKDGHFRIERPLPPSFVNNQPIRLEFVDSNHLYARLEDLRVFSPDQQMHLHIGLLDGNIVTGTVRDLSNQPIANAKVHASIGNQIFESRDAISDNHGHFELKGLPYKQVDLRVLAQAKPLLFQTGAAKIDLSRSARMMDIQVLPLLPEVTTIRDLLGMKVVNIDKALQGRLFLDHPAILILDPGPHSQRMGMNTLHAGDCFWARDGETIIGDVAGYAKCVVAHFNAVERGRPVRIIYGIKGWGDISVTGSSGNLDLTESELSQLRQQ